MPSKENTDFTHIIKNNSSIQQVVSRVSPELTARRYHKPAVCNVFMNDSIRTDETDDYKFEIHVEAKKRLPDIIGNKVQILKGMDSADESFKKKYCKKRNIGIVFSGGPAPGGHNVIAGMYDAAKKANPESAIYGFLLGPDGIIENECVELTDDIVDAYRNLGGFGMIKTGRTKIDSKGKTSLSKETCSKLKLDALVIVGGDDSNTNAAFLAQDMFDDGVQIIGVPKTIDGDIQVRDANGTILCAISFGFHTAALAFANSVSNLCTDSSSDVKYWHICKVMGRVASHLALEVALQTHANITLIGEDLADYVDVRRLEKAKKDGTVDYTAFGMTLRHLSRMLCDGIVRRAAVGKNFGVIVIPEGVLEFVNEIQVFIIKLNTIIAKYNSTHDNDFHSDFPVLEEKLDYLRRLAKTSREEGGFTIWNTRDDDLFNDIPAFFQEGLLTERDSHGNFQFSQVETDKVLMGLVKDYLKILKEKGQYKVGIKKSYFSKTLKKGNLNPDLYGPALFNDYKEEFLIVKDSITSLKTLTMELVKEGFLAEDEKIPGPVEKIYKKSVPSFKTQLHFYGYDGRGNDPSGFDCVYGYNLGLTAFSLVANGATGQMAAIKNLEKEFNKWEPIGIPIAPLMRIEERKGKMELVLEKTIVDVNSPAFNIVKELREKWLGAYHGEDNYRKPGPIRFSENCEENRPLTFILNELVRQESGK
ncbi:MAG: 6-phosphofructokinase [Proteobacteria bacterium]|nr:6-phosphofructokinase [Pseudomonadota bacterium]